MPSYIDWVRDFCLSLPHTTEKIQWVHNLLFCVGGKMYCVVNLEPALSATKISLKCTPEKFAELIEIEGIIPAPYMARNHWVAFTEMSALRQPEISQLIHCSYRLVLEKLPQKVQAELLAQPLISKTAVKNKRPGRRKATAR
jgi:predicted DNA-binding protein (MmcQ/YjbR family)